MSAIVSLRGLSKSFGARALFQDLSLTVSDGERVGLIGANGSGKSTLLKIMAGIETADAGERVTRRQAALAYVPQRDVFTPGAPVFGVVAEACPPLPEADLHLRVGQALSVTGFSDPRQKADALSGGQSKRLALARALVTEPDLLLLDEPTNHMDLESILWLEKLLSQARFACVVISHDRAFLENAATRTVELGRAYPGGTLAVDGPYSAFLEKREEFLAAQAGLERALATKVRREIEWLRRGAKARTTKAKGRIGQAGRLMDDLAEARERNAARGRAGIDFTGSGRQTRRLVSAEGVGKSLGGRALFTGLDVLLSPGDRLGIAGPNGAGKTTLLRVLAGGEEPDMGGVSFAPSLATAVFGQRREQLDPDVTLKQALAPHGDSVVYRGRLVHVATWAKRFLFSPAQLDLPVGLLSGGEQAKLLIARLMLRPADVLFLDEPTNDLDIPTLEVLEESLLDFPGAVALITHDRCLLDAVSTRVLGLDGRGGARFYADHAQFEEHRLEIEREAAPEKQKPAPARDKPVRKKLTYKEQREYDSMEEAIARAEESLEAASAALEDPAVASDHAELASRLERFEAAKAKADGLYARWAELEEKIE
jgi:ATP-binding cassette subfamily F protein uup